MAPPQLAHVQLPENFGRSLGGGTVAEPKSSPGAGSPASSAKSGMSGASDAAVISGADWLLFLFLP